MNIKMTKVSTSESLNGAISKYLEYCEIEKNLSQNTVKMYHFYLNDFLEWLKNNLKIKEPVVSSINYEDVKKYRIDLNHRISSKSHQEFKKSTQKTFLIALRAFLRYLIIEEGLEVLSPEQIILGKSGDRVPKVLNDDQMQILFTVQDLNRRSGLRDRVILEVLFSTGLRVSELVALNRDDVNLKSDEFTVVGKGGKARTVYLSKSALEWLKKYLATRRKSVV